MWYSKSENPHFSIINSSGKLQILQQKISKHLFCLSAQVCCIFSLAQMYLGLLAGETTVAILQCPWRQASYGYKWVYYLIMKRQDFE